MDQNSIKITPFSLTRTPKKFNIDQFERPPKPLEQQKQITTQML